MSEYWENPCCGKAVGIGTGPISIAAGGIVVYCLLPPGHEGPCDPCPGYPGAQHPPLMLEGEAADRVIEILRRRGVIQPDQSEEPKP